jgi:serine protease Do
MTTSSPLAIGRSFALSLLGGLLATLALCVAAPSSMAQPMPGSFAPLVRRVLPAVVNIAVTETVSGEGNIAKLLPPELRGTPFAEQFLRHFHESGEVRAAASGFIIDPSGIIVTNNHVVDGASRILVSLADRQTLAARVIGADPLTDIAVLKVDAGEPLPFVRFGNSADVQVGDWILACGNPFGLGGTVTAGIVSAEGRDIDEGPFDRFLQIDAPLNPGNSGGPLFDLQGEVVGMNTAIVAPNGGSVGIGFAIPSNALAPIVAELRASGFIRRGWLGVSIESLPDDAGRDAGVIVTGVTAGGPAEMAGIRPGDVLLAVNGTSVPSTLDLLRTVAALPPGSRTSVTLNRNGARMALPITVGERPANAPE